MIARVVRPSKYQLSSGSYKVIDGIWHKRCTGPAHEEPEYLPATEKYFHFNKTGKLAGRPLSRCRLCTNWHKLKSPGSYHGYVPIAVIRPFVQEAVNRIGLSELAIRAGVGRNTVYKILKKNEGSVWKSVARKLMLELTSLQRKEEFSVNERARWQTQRRNSRGMDRCSGCGGLSRNVTNNCSTCYERHRGWFRAGKITKKEWELIKSAFRETK